MSTLYSHRITQICFTHDCSPSGHVNFFKHDTPTVVRPIIHKRGLYGFINDEHTGAFGQPEHAQPPELAPTQHQFIESHQGHGYAFVVRFHQGVERRFSHVRRFQQAQYVKQKKAGPLFPGVRVDQHHREMLEIRYPGIVQYLNQMLTGDHGSAGHKVLAGFIIGDIDFVDQLRQGFRLNPGAGHDTAVGQLRPVSNTIVERVVFHQLVIGGHRLILLWEHTGLWYARAYLDRKIFQLLREPVICVCTWLESRSSASWTV